MKLLPVLLFAASSSILFGQTLEPPIGEYPQVPWANPTPAVVSTPADLTMAWNETRYFSVTITDRDEWIRMGDIGPMWYVIDQPGYGLSVTAVMTIEPGQFVVNPGTEDSKPGKLTKGLSLKFQPPLI
jgi:hypothetical protein